MARAGGGGEGGSAFPKSTSNSIVASEKKKSSYLEKANSMHFYLKEIVSEETSCSPAAWKGAQRQVNAKQPQGLI